MKSGLKSALLLVVLALFTSNALAQRTLSYQGVVQDKNGNYLEGPHSVTVKLYNGSDTTSFWEETQHPTFTKGLFSMVIGTLRKLPALAIETPGIDHYMLGVSIDDGAEMTPRTMLTDAPAAFFADTAAFARAVDPASLSFVSAINGIKTSPIIVGKGATSVTTHSDSIIINSPVQTPDIIQGVMNRDGSISINNGGGPVPEISVGPLGVTTANLAKSSVTTDRIATSAVTNDRIATNAVTNDKIGSGSTTQGFVLSADGNGGTVWQSPVAAALSLPFASTQASASSLFAITNTGTGAGLAGTSTMNGVLGTTTTSAGVGMLGTTSDGGSGTIANSGVNGTTQGGNGVAGIATTGNAIYGVTNTTGIGVHGVTAAAATTARAALFENLGSTTTGNVLESKALGTGSAGLFQVNNTGNASPALDVSTNGNGRAGRFQITSATSTAPSVEATTSSATGLALKASSATSTSANGTAFVQNTGTAGYAIQGDHTGDGYGVAGFADGSGSTGRGVYGWASNSAGTATGVYGQAEGVGAKAISGLANNTSGVGVGVFGQTNAAGVSNQTANNAAGVYGYASNSSSSNAVGVYGQTDGPGSDGVLGYASSSSGTGIGVAGLSNGATGVGVYGQTNGASDGAIGMFGVSNNTVSASGTFAGVRGDCWTPSATGYGVFGQVRNAGPGMGVFGTTTGSGNGVFGSTTGAGNGVFGQTTGAGSGVRGTTSNSGPGVFGVATSTTTTCYGVLGQGYWGVNGQTTFVGGYGVSGSASSSTGYGVFGTTGSTTGTGTGVYAFVGGTAATSIGTSNALIANYGGSGTSSTTANNIAIFTAGSTRRFRFDNTGNAFTSGGSWTSGGADVAESFEVIGQKSEYEPGDVLVLSEDATYHVAKCSAPYSKAVAGVYATAPGVLLGLDGTNDATIKASAKVPLGVIGVLPTKVSAENGPIEVGDLLVTSSSPGYAMKGDDSKLRFGNILGKAMEPLKSGKAVIKVLVGKY